MLKRVEYIVVANKLNESNVSLPYITVNDLRLLGFFCFCFCFVFVFSFFSWETRFASVLMGRKVGQQFVFVFVFCCFFGFVFCFLVVVVFTQSVPFLTVERSCVVRVQTS